MQKSWRQSWPQPSTPTPVAPTSRRWVARSCPLSKTRNAKTATVGLTSVALPTQTTTTPTGFSPFLQGYRLRCPKTVGCASATEQIPTTATTPTMTKATASSCSVATCAPIRLDWKTQRQRHRSPLSVATSRRSRGRKRATCGGTTGFRPRLRARAQRRRQQAGRCRTAPSTTLRPRRCTSAE